jgi:hypothetical protein
VILLHASPLATRFFLGKFSPEVNLAVGWVKRALPRNPPSGTWDWLPACLPSGENRWYLCGSSKRCHEEGDRLEAYPTGAGHVGYASSLSAFRREVVPVWIFEAMS